VGNGLIGQVGLTDSLSLIYNGTCPKGRREGSAECPVRFEVTDIGLDLTGIIAAMSLIWVNGRRRGGREAEERGSGGAGGNSGALDRKKKLKYNRSTFSAGGERRCRLLYRKS
jgi:hypothetical protein